MLSKRDNKKQTKAFTRLLVPNRRISFNNYFKEAVKITIESDKDTFDKDFFKDTAHRYYELEKTYWNMVIVIIVITAFLASRLLGGAEISIFGLSIKSQNGLREPLLFIVSVLGLFTTFKRNQLDKISAILKIYATRKSDDNNEPIYMARYPQLLPMEPYLIYPSKNTFVKNPGKICALLFILLLMLMVIFIAAVAIGTGIINAYDVYSNPSSHPILSYFVVAVYIMSVLLSIAFSTLVYFPWSYKDFSPMYDLEELKKAQFYRV